MDARGGWPMNGRTGLQGLDRSFSRSETAVGSFKVNRGGLRSFVRHAHRIAVLALKEEVVVPYIEPLGWALHQSW
jgi:hypothetical protein